jgi:hypothetical protein
MEQFVSFPVFFHMVRALDAPFPASRPRCFIDLIDCPS